MPISEVYEEDNMIGMKRYPDGYFDLSIVDPPYGINAPNMGMGQGAKNHNKNKLSTALRLKEERKGRLNQGSGVLKDRILNRSKIGWDNAIPSDEYFAELKRVSKNQIIWGGNYFPLPPTRGIVCWDKVQPWENFSQWEMAWTSFNRPAAMYRQACTGGANLETKIHPTQKSIALYKWLLHKFAKPGDKILDTHMGSQSSRIAAFNMGFDYWGWEIDAEYFKDGNRRFKQQTAQLQLL